MNKSKFVALLAGCAALPLLAIVCCSGPGRNLPCDIYASDGAPCVTAHSTTRLLSSKYHGPLYQVRRESDGALLDVRAGRDGYADAAAQDAFLKNGLGVITVIYDQSGLGNDLLPAPPGTFKGPDKGEFNTLAIADMAPVLVDGHKAYGAYMMPGMGYRCNNARGLAINDEPEGIYYVIDGRHFDSGCCFDYGNSSTNGDAVGTGTMETTYYGTATAWGSGNGDGPWIMSDMEAGLFSGYNHKKNDVPSITDWDFLSVFVNGGGGNQWDLRGADASSDSLIVFYSGVRPHTKEGSDAYYPMHKKGGMLLGNGGDNGNGSAGTFFEGVMTFGYPSDEAINAVQKNIASVKYQTYPVSMTRLTSFVPGQKSTVTLAFTNPYGKDLKDFAFECEAPAGWEIAPVGDVADDVTADGVLTALFEITAPEGRSNGYAGFTASWKGGSASVSQRVRCAEPVKINEVKLSSPTDAGDQFIELYNADAGPVDLSGMQLVIRRSGWAPVTAAVIPQGTVLAAGQYWLATLAAAAAVVPAAKGDTQINLSGDVPAGASVQIGAEVYGISAAGVPAGAMTKIFIPVSTGPWLEFPAGTTNLPVFSVDGFEAGQMMGIDLGGNYETVKVTSVGKAATQTSLEAEAKAGDTTLTLNVTANLSVGDKVTVDTGDRTETVTVSNIVKVSNPPAPRRFGMPREPHEPGIIEIEAPLEKDHMLKVDVSCPGTGISFEPATRYAHRSGDAAQPLGYAYTLDRPLAEDVAAFQAVFAEASGDLMYGYAASSSAGSIALVDPASGTVVDSIVYGSQQSSSSGNGTIASPELATLEGEQSGGGCIAVVPQAPRPSFGPFSPTAPVFVPEKSLVRIPDGSDIDALCKDFRITELPTPGAANTIPIE